LISVTPIYEIHAPRQSGFSPPAYRAPVLQGRERQRLMQGGRSPQTDMILSVHTQIVRAALGETGAISPNALRDVVSANLWCDLHQLSPERHFDNGPNPAALCALWQRGVDTYLRRAVAACMPGPPAASQSPDVQTALRAFGQATHALADFYSHTNWIELAVARGEEPLPAPLVDDTCAPDCFPAELQSGYFSVRHGLSGCPTRGGKPCPPAGYRYCHAQLNKDAPNRGHGAERTSPTGTTYHEVAVGLAIAATRESWDALRGRLWEAYGPAAEDIVTRLERGPR
jgi:hypothetical protein